MLINLRSTSSWHSGSTNLSNLCDASEKMSYFTDLPIIASGLKNAHSTRTVFVSDLHEVPLPPIIPARLMTLLSKRKTEFLLVRFIWFPRRVSNAWLSSISLKYSLLFILFAS